MHPRRRGGPSLDYYLPPNLSLVHAAVVTATLLVEGATKEEEEKTMNALRHSKDPILPISTSLLREVQRALATE